MLTEKVRIKRNVLSKEKCEEIIANYTDYEYDLLKTDFVQQSKYSDKETLDAHTVVSDQETTFKTRKVAQSSIKNHIFPEWDGLPVYRSKVMKYEIGDFIDEHRDAQWMCLSNYWEPDTNKASRSLMVVPLNDDYEGGELTVEGEVIPQKVGSVIQIPQSVFDHTKSARHGIREVKSGTRYALVFWNFE